MNQIHKLITLLAIFALSVPSQALATVPHTYTSAWHQQTDDDFRAGISLWHAGNYADALMVFEKSLDAARQRADIDAESSILLHMTLVHLFNSVTLAMNGSLTEASAELMPMLEIADQLAVLNLDNSVSTEAIYMGAEQLLQNYLALSGVDDIWPTINIDRHAMRIADGYRQIGSHVREAAVLNRILSRGMLGSSDEGGIDLDEAQNIRQRAFEASLAAGDIENAAKNRVVGGGEIQWTDPEQALAYYNQALAILQTAEDKEIEADIFYNIGGIYNTGEGWQPNAALEAYTHAYERFHESGNVGMTLLSLKNVAALQEDQVQRLETLLKIEELYELHSTNEPDDRISNLDSILELYDYLDTLDDSFPLQATLEARQEQLRRNVQQAQQTTEFAVKDEMYTYLGALQDQAQTFQDIGDIPQETAVLEQVIDEYLQFQRANDFIKMDMVNLDKTLVRLLDLYTTSGNTQGRATTSLHLCAYYLHNLDETIWSEASNELDPAYPIADSLIVCNSALSLISETGFDSNQALILTDIIRQHESYRDFDRDNDGWIEYGPLLIPSYQTALQPFEQWVEANQADLDSRDRLNALEGLAGIFEWTGDYQSAIAYYSRALEEHQEATAHPVDFSERRIRLLYSLIRTHYQLGDFDGAFTRYRDLFDGVTSGEVESVREYARRYLLDRSKNWSPSNQLISQMGEAERTAGQYELALELYQWRQHVQEIIFQEAQFTGMAGALMGEGTLVNRYQLPIADTLIAQAEIHEILGNYTESIDFYRQMVDFLRDIGGGRYLHASMVSRLDKQIDFGDMYRLLHRNKQAFDMYVKVKDSIIYDFFYFSASLYIPDARVTTKAFHRIGSIQLLNGEPATSIFFSYVAYLNLFLLAQDKSLPAIEEISGDDQLLVGDIFAQLGDAYRAMGHDGLMGRSYSSAFTLYQSFLERYTGKDEQAITLLINSGTIQALLGELEDAADLFRQAIDLVETIQGDLRIEQWKTSYIGNQADLYARLIDLLWESGQIDEAFDYAERGLARVFLDQIGNQRIDFSATRTPDLIDREQQLSQRIIGLQNALQAEREKPEAQRDATMLAALSGELEQKRGEYAALLDEIKNNNPEYASLISVDTVRLPNVQEQILDGETTLIEYLTLEEYTLAWVIDRDHAELILLDVAQEDLNRTVTYIRDQIRFSAEINDLAEQLEFSAEIDMFTNQLYKQLILPLRSYLQHDNLIIVPHGPLHYLPFGALWNSEDGKFLVEEFALSYAPSASVLRFIQQKRNQNDAKMLIMGNPDRSLTNAEVEVQQVAELFDATLYIHEDATEDTFYWQLAQEGPFDYLHLAAHGVYEPFTPLDTRVELKSAATNPLQDGKLKVHEVFGLDLSGTNLVTLSACETAAGALSDGGELVGLTRAFLYAGSPSVITTLWKIGDEASAELMQKFYQNLQEGMDTTEALQAAQMWILAQEKWRTPYYWAAFNLTGDYGQLTMPN